MRGFRSRLHPGLSALFEVGILFLPAIPAYLWVWPVLEGKNLWNFQVLVYLYVLAGTLFIGLRRWNLDQLGINGKGIMLSLGCGFLILAGRTLVTFSVDWGLSPPQFTFARILEEAGFYFILVGVGEELLFRGLVYRAFNDWIGTRWAIWGSSVGFMLWHIVGQGPLIGIATLFYGLIFAFIRWRAGGIMGLILVHGLMDFVSAQMLPNTDVVALGRPDVPYPGLLFIGLALLLFVPVFLSMIYPVIFAKKQRIT